MTSEGLGAERQGWQSTMTNILKWKCKQVRERREREGGMECIAWHSMACLWYVRYW